MPLSQKLCIASNYPLRVKELPRGCDCIDHRVALTPKCKRLSSSAARWARDERRLLSWQGAVGLEHNACSPLAPTAALGHSARAWPPLLQNDVSRYQQE